MKNGLDDYLEGHNEEDKAKAIELANYLESINLSKEGEVSEGRSYALWLVIIFFMLLLPLAFKAGGGLIMFLCGFSFCIIVEYALKGVKLGESNNDVK